MRVLFLGLGGVGQRHLRNLKALRPDAEIAAVRHGKRAFEITADLKADTSVDIAKKYAIIEFPRIAEAVARFRPDFAIIASPSSVHATQTIELLRAGVPVFLEKPISVDSLELDNIADLLGQGHGPVMVGYMLRFHPAFTKFRELFLSGLLGRLYSGQVVANTYMPDWHPYEGPKDFYAGRKDLGGGVILTNVHLIDLMVWLLGRPRTLWTLGGSLSPLKLDVEDSTVTLFDYPAPVSLHLSFVQKPVENFMTLRGENGRLRWDLGLASVVFDASDGKSQQYDFSSFSWNDMFVAELAHFIGAVEARAKPQAAYQDVLDGHRVALAMKQSLQSGQPMAFG